MGPRTQIMRSEGPNIISSMAFGPKNPIIWVLGPLGLLLLLYALLLTLQKVR